MFVNFAMLVFDAGENICYIFIAYALLKFTEKFHHFYPDWRDFHLPHYYYNRNRSLSSVLHFNHLTHRKLLKIQQNICV